MDGWSKMIISKVNEQMKEDYFKDWTFMAFESHESYMKAFRGYSRENVLPFFCNQQEIKELIQHYGSLGMKKGIIEEFDFGIIAFIKG